MTRSQRSTNLVLVVLFLAGIGTVAYETGRRMLRDRKEFPDGYPVLKFPSVFEKYFNEHFAWRFGFLNANAVLKSEMLGVSATPRVSIGPNGWMFYETTLEAEAIKALQVSDDLIIERWTMAISRWREWIESQGSKLLVVVAPDKQSVYPEELPYGRGERKVPSLLDRIMSNWAKDTKAQVLDLRTDLKAAKQDYTLYYKRDTHWNSRGSFVGYQATARALGNTPWPMSKVDWKTVPIDKPDLPRMMAETRLIPEDYDHPLIMDHLRSRDTKETVQLTTSRWLKHLNPQARQTNDATLPRIVLVHDSFANQEFIFLLSEHARRLVAVPSYTPDDLVIAREKPDVVVWLFVERTLRAGLPTMPPPVSPQPPAQPQVAAR